jgi:hypothetical protein
VYWRAYTHCNVAALSNRLPLYDELCNRTINFHCGCLKSKNCIIRNLTNYTMFDEGAQSPHGRNIRFICSKFSLSFSVFSKITCHTEVTFLFQRIDTTDYMISIQVVLTFC